MPGHPPNVRLRQQREQRAWKLDDVVRGLDELVLWLAEKGPEGAKFPGTAPPGKSPRRAQVDLGVDVNMVARWERGYRKPGLRYALLLSLLFDEEPEQLGLDSGVRLVAEYRRLAPVRRREFMIASGKTAAAMAAGAIGGDWERALAAWVSPKPLDERRLADLHALTRTYAGQVFALSPASLLPAVQAHLAILKDVLSSSLSPSLRVHLCRVVGETALVAGRLCTCLENQGDSEIYKTLAERVAREADDGPLLACVLSGKSVLLSDVYRDGRSADSGTVLALLDAAEVAAGPQAPPYVRASILAQRAEEHASRLESVTAWRNLEAAERIAGIERGGGDEILVPWSPDWLADYRGSCAMLLRRPQEAVAILEPGIAAMAEQRHTPHVAAMTDLAEAYVQAGEIEEACRLVAQAFAVALEGGFASSQQRVRRVRRRLEPFRHTAAVGHLDEQLALA